MNENGIGFKMLVTYFYSLNTIEIKMSFSIYFKIGQIQIYMYHLPDYKCYYAGLRYKIASTRSLPTGELPS